MFGPLPYPFRLSPLHIIPVFPLQIWNINQVQDPQCVRFSVFYLFFRCSESWFPFLSFFPPYLGGGTECFDRAVCGLVRARSCDTGVTSMGRRTDARFCLIGSAHFPSIAQNGEKKRGDMANRFNNDFLKLTSIDFYVANTLNTSMQFNRMVLFQFH